MSNKEEVSIPGETASPVGVALGTSLKDIGSEEYPFGITLDDFVVKDDRPAINIGKLKRDFKKICNDYGEELGEDKSVSVEICSIVLYTIGPESTKLSKNSDERWKLIFGDTESSRCVVHIAMHKNNIAQLQGNSMLLSVQEAQLLAHDTFERLCNFAYKKDPKNLMLTYLAAARFRRSDIPKLADDLGLDVITVLHHINQSVLIGGEVLPYGNVNFAAAAAIAVNCGKQEDIVKSIVIRIFKEYMKMKKVPKKEELEVVSRYVISAVPPLFQYENLINIYEQSRKRAADKKLKLCMLNIDG